MLDEAFARAFSLTLGEVVSKLDGVLPPELMVRLRNAVVKRNFLAHQFWFERAHLCARRSSVLGLLAELRTYVDLFEGLDHEVSELNKQSLQGRGVSDADVQGSFNRLLAGDLEDPVPDRDAIRELDKSIRKPQKLVRVWELNEPDGRKPLIFELEDGSLWQLSDAGLGWTRPTAVGEDWRVHSQIQPHLPAEISLRPNRTGPWEYEFALRGGVVLWIKPGTRVGTFKWGLRGI